MKTLREKVIEIYTNEKLYRPPSMGYIAKKLGVSKGIVHKYIHELSTGKSLRKV